MFFVNVYQGIQIDKINLSSFLKRLMVTHFYSWTEKKLTSNCLYSFYEKLILNGTRHRLIDMTDNDMRILPLSKKTMLRQGKVLNKALWLNANVQEHTTIATSTHSEHACSIQVYKLRVKPILKWREESRKPLRQFRGYLSSSVRHVSTFCFYLFNIGFRSRDHVLLANLIFKSCFSPPWSWSVCWNC